MRHACGCLCAASLRSDCYCQLLTLNDGKLTICLSDKLKVVFNETWGLTRKKPKWRPHTTGWRGKAIYKEEIRPKNSRSNKNKQTCGVEFALALCTLVVGLRKAGCQFCFARVVRLFRQTNKKWRRRRCRGRRRSLGDDGGHQLHYCVGVSAARAGLKWVMEVKTELQRQTSALRLQQMRIGKVIWKSRGTENK